MNLFKILPLAIVALISFWLATFNILTLSTSPEIILDLGKFLSVLIWVTLFSSLFICATLFVFALVGNEKTYLWSFSGLIAVSYIFLVIMTSIGIASGMIILASIVISAILALTLPIGFMETYENLIKPKLEVCSRSIISNFILFASLACAVNFLIIYNNPQQRESLKQRIFEEIEKTVELTSGQATSIISQQMRIPTGTVSNTLIRQAMEQQILTPARTALNTYMDLVVYGMALLLFITVASIRPFISIATFLVIVAARFFLTSIGYLKEEKRMVEATRLTL